MEFRRWEYYSLPFPGKTFCDSDIERANLKDRLNDLGREGWELVSVFTVSCDCEFTGDSAAIAVFKRPLGI